MGAPTLGGRQHTILTDFPKNCMKFKEFGPRGGTRVPHSPLRSANVPSQWRIQDFPRWGCQISRGRQHTFLSNFPKNCMKLKEFWTPRVGRASFSPLRSTNELILSPTFFKENCRTKYGSACLAGNLVLPPAIHKI